MPIYDYTVKCPHCGGEGFLSFPRPGEAGPADDSLYANIAATKYHCSMCAWRPKFDAIPPTAHRGLVLTSSLEGCTIWKYRFDTYYQINLGSTKLAFVNADHLQATIDYIEDPLRNVNKVPQQWRKFTLKLPKEVQDGRHRQRVVKRLRKLLLEGPACNC